MFSTEVEYLKDYLVANEREKVVVYVYSWDHIYKNIFFSNRVFLYLVWDYEQKEELVFVHGIDKNKIKVIGSTFHHVHDYEKEGKKKIIQVFQVFQKLEEKTRFLLWLQELISWYRRSCLSLTIFCASINISISHYGPTHF